MLLLTLTYPHTHKFSRQKKFAEKIQEGEAMEQGGAGGDGGDRNEQRPPQDHKGKKVMQQEEEVQVQSQGVQAEIEVEVESAPPPQLPQQPVQCPRCDSFNTKFCYYNNYSLTQPRFLCRTCKRYWTHGGTLRNVPIGGSCRKSKRGRDDSQSSSSSAPPSQEIQVVVQAQPPASQPAHTVLGARDIFPLGFPSHLTTFLQGGVLGLGVGSDADAAATTVGGYLSSLGVGGTHRSSLNPPNNPFDQVLNAGAGRSNNNNVANSVGPHHQFRTTSSQAQQYFQFGVRDQRDVAVGPLFPPPESQQQQGLMMMTPPSSTMGNSSTIAAAASASIHSDWIPHRFISDNAAPAAAANNNNINGVIRATDGSVWRTISTTTLRGNRNGNGNGTGNNSQIQRNIAAASGSSAAANVMPNNQRPNVPGFGHPPPPPSPPF